MLLAADGSVKPCCFATQDLGNLNEATAEEIWNGPRIVELRAFIKHNKIHPVCDGAICKFVQNMKKDDHAPTSSPAFAPQDEVST